MTDAAGPGFRKSVVREYFESICVAVILAFFVRTFVVQAFKIPSGSMEPNLLIGDHLLVNKFVFAPTLTSLERRVDLLVDAGADAVLVLPFDRGVAAWTPEEFVERVLVDGLHAKAVVVGANFRFGARAAGDVATLREEGERHDFEVEGIALDGGPQVWSSTYVRTCLAAGDVEGAAEALGRPYSLAGRVVGGERRGRQLGYPTANVPTHGLAAPADGVYAGWLSLPDTPDQPALPAAISVGTNPTFDGERERRVEAYVLDRRDLELYDVRVQISFVARIRGMVAFDGVDALLAAMSDDVERVRAILGVTAPRDS